MAKSQYGARARAPSLVVVAALGSCGFADEPALGSGAGELVGDVGLDMDEGEGARPIEVGTLSDEGVLHPWQDGELVEVVLGLQGFEMFSFHIEAPLEAGDPAADDWCVRSQFVQDPSDPLASAGSCHGAMSELVDGRVRFGPVLRILTTKDVRGEPRSFAVELSTESFTTVEVVEIELY